jgi:hypothetical protein
MLQKEDFVHQSDHTVVNSSKHPKQLTIILTSVLLLTVFGLGGYWLSARQPQSFLQTRLKEQPELPHVTPDIYSEEADYLLDSAIKWYFTLIAQALSCHKSLHGIYPPDLQSFDKGCFPSGEAPLNPNTNKPFHYDVTNDGKNYLLRAKISTGEIYTMTDKSATPTQLPVIQR